MTNMVYEIGILGRMRMDAHSLNNEGTVGNVTEPRTVILADGTKTDGISGEMLKHIHVESLWQLAKVANINLCEACKIMSPMKADGNSQVTSKKKALDAVKEALNCVVCDTHGFLVQEPTVNRKSTVEFGWALGIPEKFYRDIHVHTRVALGEKKREKGKEAEVSEQMIYNRPTRSGVYAMVSVFQPWRVGLNEVNYNYELDNKNRKERYELVLDSYKSMMMRLEGAMTTTRLPHFGAFEGVIVTSQKGVPVPIVSPLIEGYKDQVKKISKGANIKEFGSLSEFLVTMDTLKELVPYRLGVKE